MTVFDLDENPVSNDTHTSRESFLCNVHVWMNVRILRYLPTFCLTRVIDRERSDGSSSYCRVVHLWPSCSPGTAVKYAISWSDAGWHPSESATSGILISVVGCPAV